MKPYLMLTVLCHLCFALSAQNYAVDQIPNNLRSRASAVIREEYTEIDMKNDANITEKVTMTLTILNKAGEEYGDLNIYYNKGRTVRSAEGIIYDEFGNTIKKFKLKDFSDYSASSGMSMFDDIRVKHYSTSMHTYPYTISYTYEIKHSQNLSIPYWRPNVIPDIAVEKSSYLFSCKPEQLVRIKEENVPNLVKIDSTIKAKTYLWQASNLQARKSEPYSPINLPNLITVKIVPKDFQFFKKRGQVSTWKEMGKWIYDDLLADKHDLPETTKAKAKEIASHFSTDQEKAKALYEYMQSKTRYISIQIGLGGIEPFPASYVDKLGYGDCKALVNYMQALLKAVDISSDYCIVEAGNQKVDLDKEFANIVDGNHIILCIPFAKDTTWLECTSNKAPYGYLGDFTDDRLVLSCTPEGGKILRTPQYHAEDNLQLRKGKLHIDNNGALLGHIQTDFLGTQFDNHFQMISLTGSELDKALKSTYDINNITFKGVKHEVNNKGKEAILTEKIDLEVNNYAVNHNNSLIFSPNIFNISRTIPETKNRTHEVYINRGYTDIDDLEIALDHKIKSNVSPINTKLSCPMGEYELNIVYKDKIVNLTRKLAIKPGTYPAADYEKFVNFMKNVSSSDRGRFTLPIE